MDRLDRIFQGQLNLIHTISPVYSSNGFDEWTRPPMMDSRIHQAHIKYVGACFIEELVEAEGEGPEKVAEEVVDSLHFLVEMMIMCQLSPHTVFHFTMKSIGQQAVETIDRLDYMFFACGTHHIADNYRPLERVIIALGRFTYHLKQKPWRVTHKPTALEDLRISAGLLFHAFIIYAQTKGLTAQQLFAGYFDKNETNHNRVQEKY